MYQLTCGTNSPLCSVTSFCSLYYWLNSSTHITSSQSTSRSDHFLFPPVLKLITNLHSLPVPFVLPAGFLNQYRTEWALVSVCFSVSFFIFLCLVSLPVPVQNLADHSELFSTRIVLHYFVVVCRCFCLLILNLRFSWGKARNCIFCHRTVHSRIRWPLPWPALLNYLA